MLRGRRALRVPLPDRPRHPRRVHASTAPFERRPGVGRVYRNPELEPADFVPRLRVLVVRHRDEPRRAAALLDRRGGRGRRARAGWSGRARPRRSRAPRRVARRARAASTRFLAHVRAADPDVLTGWNVGDFDLARAPARRAGAPASAARSAAPTTSSSCGATRASRASRARCSPAAQVLDGLALLRERLHPARRLPARDRGAGAPRQGQALPGPSTAARRSRRVSRRSGALAAYNLEDARLVLEILDAHRARRAGRAAEPADRHAARPRERADRVGRLALPGARSAPAAAWRRRSTRRRAGGDGHRRRPRARLASRASTGTSSSSTSRACTRA